MVDIRNIPIKISYHHVKFFIHFITLDRVNLVHLSWIKKEGVFMGRFSYKEVIRDVKGLQRRRRE